MKRRYEDILSRYSKAKANKQAWDSHLEECYEFAMPERNIIDNASNGSKKNLRMFDSTAVASLEDYATRMESEIVPPTLNWCKLEAGSEVPEDSILDVDKYLDETTKILFENIRSSNFSSMVHEAFLDLGISTGALIVEAGDGIQSSLNFRAVNLGELSLEKSAKGIPETVFRDIKVPVRDISSIWQHAKLSTKLKRMVKNTPDDEVSIIEGVIEEQGKYSSILLCTETSDILFQKDVESNPWVVFRESTIPGETYGRGRVMRALPDIKTLNKMVEDHLIAAAITAHPIYTIVDDGVINPYITQESIQPGRPMVVGSNDSSNPSISTLPTGGDYNVLQYDIGQLQDTIRTTLLSKPFGNVEETPVRSATEMSIRNAELAKTSIGASGRIQVELIERVVARCVYILKKAGKIADFRVDGKEVKIKYTSPAARAQDEQILAQYARFAEFMGMFPPEMVSNSIKIEDIPGEVADIMGLPAKIKRSELEMQQRQQAAAQAQQQVAQAQHGAEMELKHGQQ